jgi:hypothetical protein
LAPRIGAGLLLSLLLLSVFFAILPVAPASGSSGSPVLGVTDTDSTQPTTFTAGTSFVSVTAGSDAASTDGNTAGFFAIDFGTFGGAQLVTFSGAQFTLYFSQDGLAQISPTDIKYTGPTPFNVADLTTNAGWHTVDETNGTYYVGQTISMQEVLVGPLPISVTTAYQYVKIFEGSSAAVSVSVQTVKMLPGLKITPTSGSAGETITVSAGGFPASKVVELTYSYTYYPWNGASATRSGNWSTGINTGAGDFKYNAAMLDTKQAYNPAAGVRTSTHIDVDAKLQASPHTLYASAGFDESSRVFREVNSYSSGGNLISSTSPPADYGNDSSLVGSNLPQPINAAVLGNIGVSGNHWMADSAVTFWVGGTETGSTTTNASGYFNATMSVPILPAGGAEVTVVNNGVTYEFGVNILQSMVLTPSSSSVGGLVSVQVYGFPANTMWFIYWHGYTASDTTWYQVAHGTTGVLGTFNVTVSFLVPNSNVGNHGVTASSTNVSSSSPSSPGVTEASATMNVGTATSTTTSTTETTTVFTTVTQTTTETQPTTVYHSTTQTEFITNTATQTQTVVQVTTTTTTNVAAADMTFTYVALGAAVVVILGLAAWVLRLRRP